jgi:predicted transcriptional regulator
MKSRSISQMPVFLGQKMVGTVTDDQIVYLVSSSPNPTELLRQRVGDHILPVFAVVGKDTPVEALFSLFRYMPAVLVACGEKVEGIITKIDLLSAGT